MAKNNNVKDFTKDIADAIRAKENSVAKINPQDFSARIAALSVGGSPKFAELVGASLTTIEASDLKDVTTIRQACFLELLSLVSVTIPDNIKTIEGMAFLLCSNVQHLDLGNGVETIGDSAFSGINAKEILLPNTLTRVGLGAFSSNNALESITIPDSLNNLPDELFTSCENLREVIMVAKIPPTVGYATFPSITQIYVPYGAYDDYVASWSAYASQIVRLPAIPSTITVIVNDYTGALVSGASVTISGNGQTYTGITDSVGTFIQGDLQPATYTISVANMEGFKTPASSEVVVEEDTQNSVTVTYLEKPALDFSRTFSENTPAQISAVANEISANNMTSDEVESTYGWKIGDTTSYTLSTGENVEMRIIGFCHDDLSDGSGKAGITLDMTRTLAQYYQMNETGTNAGGYPVSKLRTVHLPYVKTLLPQEWQDVIVKVDKKSANGGSTNYTKIVTTSEDLFVLSEIEICGSSQFAQNGNEEGVGYEYWIKHNTDDDRKKPTSTGGSGGLYWLRSCGAGDDYGFIICYSGHVEYSDYAANDRLVSYAFCIGSAADYAPSTPEEPSGGSKVYGVEWVNDASTTMTRTDDAVNMTYTKDESTGKITSDFDNVFPYNQMKRQVIDGNTFVYVPSMWFRVVVDADKKITSVAVSDKQGDGDNWYQTKPFYYGAYGASYIGSGLKSVSGEAKYSSTRPSMRSAAMAAGTGYRQRDLYAGTILMFLWWIEFANKDSKSIMTGATSSQRTGNTDTIYNEEEGGNFCVSGYNTSTLQMVWHGIEDYVSSDYEWEDGITGSGSNGSSYYASDDYTLYDEYWNGSQMPALSFKSPTTGGFCLEALGWDVSKPFLCLPIATRVDSSYASCFCTFVTKTPKETAYRGGTYGVSYFGYGSASHSSSITCGRLMKEV